jgi:hypothetical protein
VYRYKEHCGEKFIIDMLKDIVDKSIEQSIKKVVIDNLPICLNRQQEQKFANILMKEHPTFTSISVHGADIWTDAITVVIAP